MFIPETQEWAHKMYKDQEKARNIRKHKKEDVKDKSGLNKLAKMSDVIALYTLAIMHNYAETTEKLAYAKRMAIVGMFFGIMGAIIGIVGMIF